MTAFAHDTILRRSKKAKKLYSTSKNEEDAKMSGIMTNFLVVVLVTVTIGSIWLLYKSLYKERLEGMLSGISESNSPISHPSKPSGVTISAGGKKKPNGKGHTEPMPTWMIVHHGRHGIAEIPMSLNNDESCYIGADANCDIVISGSTHVSRIHAIASRDVEGYFIQNNSSVNGMYVGDSTERHNQIDITDGLCIRLADVKLTFKKINLLSDDLGATVSPTRRVRAADKVAPTRRI